MRRRSFFILGSLLGLSQWVNAKPSTEFEKEFKRVESTLRSVQEHMFPEGSQLPSARSINASMFLYATISHKNYDKDIRAFVLEGAKELMDREEGFTTYSKDQKEKALRAYEETNYGRNWLSRMMTLTMEAMFSDPIYGSNTKEAGWKAVKSFGGYPRPKRRYIGL